jgi:threonine/homoserine/homoserine lactone efflux protein
MDISVFWIFFGATLAVVLSPGPAAICAASQGAGNGLSKALSGITGIAFANVVYFALSATGIAALIIASQQVFNLIKWVGVVYLIYLGAGAILGTAGGLKIARGASMPRHKLFLQGFIVEFANPKALLYFAAILPQFINPDDPILPQILIMGGVTVVIDLSVYTAYAYLAHRFINSGVKQRMVKTINVVAGSALLLAALKMTWVTNASA